MSKESIIEQLKESIIEQLKDITVLIIHSETYLKKNPNDEVILFLLLQSLALKDSLLAELEKVN